MSVLVRIEFIGGEVAEIFGVDRDGKKYQDSCEQEFHAAPPGGAFSLVLGWACVA